MPCAFVFNCISSGAQGTFPQIEPVSYSKVQITDAFWSPKIEKLPMSPFRFASSRRRLKLRALITLKSGPKKGRKTPGNLL